MILVLIFNRGQQRPVAHALIEQVESYVLNKLETARVFYKTKTKAEVGEMILRYSLCLLILFFLSACAHNQDQEDYVDPCSADHLKFKVIGLEYEFKQYRSDSENFGFEIKEATGKMKALRLRRAKFVKSLPDNNLGVYREYQLARGRNDLAGAEITLRHIKNNFPKDALKKFLELESDREQLLKESEYIKNKEAKFKQRKAELIEKRNALRNVISECQNTLLMEILINSTYR